MTTPDPYGGRAVAAVAVDAASAAAGPAAADACRVAGLAGEIGRWIAAATTVPALAARADAARAHARNLAAAGAVSGAAAFIAGAEALAEVFTDRDITAPAALVVAAAAGPAPAPPGEHPGTPGFTVPGRVLLALRTLLLAATGPAPAGPPAGMPDLIAGTAGYGTPACPPLSDGEITAALRWIMEPGWPPPGVPPAPGTPGNTPCPLCGRARVPAADALFDVTGAGGTPVLASAVTRDQAAQILAARPGAACAVHCLGDAGEDARRHGQGAAVPCADTRCVTCHPHSAQWFAGGLGLPRYADPDIPATWAAASADGPPPEPPAPHAGRSPAGNAALAAPGTPA